MSGESAVVVPRRSRAEIAQVASSYQASGLGRSEFSRRHGMALSTLNRYLKKQPRQQKQRGNDGVGLSSLVEVKLAATTGSVTAADQPVALTVLLSNGRRVEVGDGFNDATLRRLVAVLEQL